MKKNKLIVCGGGIIGVTIAREAALSKKFTDISVIEKDDKLGTHSTTRNSGVIHAGFYYSPESIKAKFCNTGNYLIRDYCIKNNIKINKCGKVVITKNDLQEKILYELYERGKENGCNLQLLDKNQLSDFEPLANTYKSFLWSPNTWSASPKELFDCLINECKNLEIKFITGQKIVSVGSNSIKTNKNIDFYFDYFINSCGGYSLEVAKLFGINTNYKLLPFKGLYLKSQKKIKKFSRHIYPVPDINQPFLGIHTTITSDNFLKLGPTAIPAFSPENYTLFEGLDFNLSSQILFLQFNLFAKNEFGFRDLALREIQYLIKENILRKAQELTNLNLREIQFSWYSPGIRPQLYDKSSKKLENDFVLINKENTYHIINSISPAWSCSFMSAKKIINDVISGFNN